MSHLIAPTSRFVPMPAILSFRIRSFTTAVTIFVAALLVKNVHAAEPKLSDADMFQIGARNMQNFVLLSEVGKSQKPVLLKRAMSGTVADLLMSAEYVLSQGNPNVVLCERGVKGFESSTRNTLDVAAGRLDVGAPEQDPDPVVLRLEPVGTEELGVLDLKQGGLRAHAHRHRNLRSAS